MITLALLLAGATAVSTPTPTALPSELHTLLMNSTFKLAGEGSTGTAFIIGRPLVNDPARARFVLVTANHVLAQMKGDVAILNLRQQVSDGRFVKLPVSIPIRSNGLDLWVHHPTADVAAMYVAVPSQARVDLLHINMLATDSILTQFEVHPGDTLSCLGYPFGFEANDAGFPVLRSGHIASYPLTPTAITKTILYDFNVFPGNSGGPVYMVESNRVYGSGTHIGRIQFLVGLVSEQQFLEEEVKSLSETRKTRHALGLGVVVPAPFILETVQQLPEATP